MSVRIMASSAFAILFLSMNASAETIELFCSSGEGREDTIRIELPECNIHHDDDLRPDAQCSSSTFGWKGKSTIRQVTDPGNGNQYNVWISNVRYEISRNTGKLTVSETRRVSDDPDEFSFTDVVGKCERASKKF